MGGAVPFRTDYDCATLWQLAKASVDANRMRRLLALAVIYDGGKRIAPVAHVVAMLDQAGWHTFGKARQA